MDKHQVFVLADKPGEKTIKLKNVKQKAKVNERKNQYMNNRYTK